LLRPFSRAQQLICQHNALKPGCDNGSKPIRGNEINQDFLSDENTVL
jgi:hypothetical protein